MTAGFSGEKTLIFKRLPHSQAFAIAWPMILSNISSPLMGVADTAMLGHLDSSLYLGAVAIGANIIALLFWMFAFLRMGTTSFVGRAFGAGDHQGLNLQLGQSLVLAACAGVLMIALQWLTVPVVVNLMAPSDEIAGLAAAYCHIRLSAAPAVFVFYVMMGLMIGLHNARRPLAVTVLANLLNIGLDYLFIVVFQWQSEGAAWASLIAETCSGAAALWLGLKTLRENFGAFRWPAMQTLFHLPAWQALAKLNGDLFVRTTLLLLVFNFFTAQGARLGPEILAANAILMQLVLFQSFGLDGYAHAVEAMGAKALGARDHQGFLAACGASTVAAASLALAITASFWLGKGALIPLFTDLHEVASNVSTYYHWLILFPMVSVWTYLLDGIFIGAGQTRIMRNTMLVAIFAGFLPLWWLTRPWANHGLWLSFVIFNGIRGATLGRSFYTLTRGHKWF